jgi:hypothetical protein
MNSHLLIPKRRLVNTKLSKLEEEAIVRNILELYLRGFAPWVASIEDIVNYILESRRGKRVRGR